MKRIRLFTALLMGLLVTVMASGCDDKEKTDSPADTTTVDCGVLHGPGSDGVMKILAIGNSFTQDCVEQNLWDLFHAAGQEAIIANLYIGGCDLKTHYNNALADSPEYSYRKIVNGSMMTKGNVTMLYGIMDEDWDYICFHQLSSLYSSESSFYPYLPYLMQYARDNATNEEMAIAFQMTWAYPEDSTQSGFSNYNNDQMTMYNTILNTVQRLAADLNINIIIPVGTAVQNGRNTWLGDSFNRDSQHLNYTYGRYTGACAWFEKFSETDVTMTTYAPADVSDEIKDIVTHAAHYAVENPYELNPMTDWQ